MTGDGRRWRGVFWILALALTTGPTRAQTPARGGEEILNEAGRLTRNSEQLRSGEYKADHTFRAQAGHIYCARLYSTEFKPYVFAVLAEGVQLDHSGTGGSAQIAFVAPASGELRCVATSVTPGETGAYRITVTEGLISGRLSENDEKLDSGEWYDVVPFYMTANSEAAIQLASGEFAPYLITVVNENKNETTAERGAATDQSVRCTEAGEQAILVTSGQPGEKGVYELRLTAPGQRPRPGGGGGGGGGGVGGLGSILGGGGGGRGGTAEGRSVLDERGRLEQGDTTLRSGEFVDEYNIDVQAGQSITVACNSTDFDTYLIAVVPGSDDQVENDDPARGETNARLSFTAPQAGRVRILVTSARVGETGAYTVTATTRAAQTNNVLNNANGARPTLQTNAPIRGELAQGDRQLDSGEFVDIQSFTGRRGERYTITLVSQAFDPYLIVVPPGGEKVENDDAEGLDTGSRVVVEFAQDGECAVGVTSYEPGEAGAYELTIAQGGEGGGPAVAPAPGQELGVGNFFEGDLAQGDRQMQSGEWFDVHQFEAQAGQTYVVDLVSEQFDTYLIAKPPAGDQEDNDDDGGTTNSRLVVRAREAGTYQLIVTSARPGEVGRYTLSVRGDGAGGGGSRPAPEPGGAGGAGQLLQAGGDGVQTVDGAFADGDSRLESGEYSDVYNIEVQRGQWLEVQMVSDAVDPYLIVVGPGDQRGENDDLAEGASTAGVRLQCTQSGTFRVVATTYRPGEAGGYRLMMRVGGSASPGGTTTGGNQPGGQLTTGGFPSPFPGTPGGAGGPAAGGDGRATYGVFVGIDKYPDAPLQFCAGDAQNMATRFAQIGIVPPERAHVLTDQQATKANVVRALQDVARRAGPQDMVMFFFSGHGGQTPENAQSNEADQKEEFIVCIDGILMDDEMAALLDGCHAAITLIYLDSCFSGGFAKDIITKPGRMGVFSSDEDLTSNVAGKFQAGGYLSWFMLKAIDGRADKDGDKVISAAELSYYLEDSFNQEVGSIQSETSDEQRGYQRLRIDRGGVKLTTPLFFLP